MNSIIGFEKIERKYLNWGLNHLKVITMSQKESKVKCPYCGVEFDEAPNRKKMCFNCKNTLYPRINFYTDEMHYLTQRELEDFEKIRSMYKAEAKFLKKFQGYGLKQKKFEKRRKKYEKKVNKLNQEYDGFAFITSIFNELVSKNFDKLSFHDLEMMYYDMAGLLYKYNQSFFTFLKESVKMQLYHWKQIQDIQEENGKKLYVQINTFCCEKCRQLDGERYKVDEALEKMPIPVEDCESGFCQCCYTTELR